VFFNVNNNNLTKEKIMRKVLFLTTLLAFVLTSSVWAADISGNWNIKMQSPSGDAESYNIVIKQAGENLTVTTADHPKLKEMAGTGTLKGDAVTMSLKATGQMAVEIVFTGKVAGNTITGTRDIKMAASAGGAQGGAPAAGGGAQGGAPASAAPAGGAPAGGAPAGGAQGGAPAGGAPAGGAQGGAKAEVSNAFTAEKK
jgi:hypothetical protein